MMHALFAEPKTINEARRQVNILTRAETLFTTGGYDWYIADRNPYLFGICGPQGQHYGVDLDANTCTCKGFENDGDCKHRIAVANSQECAQAHDDKRMELAAELIQNAEHSIYGTDPYAEF